MTKHYDFSNAKRSEQVPALARVGVGNTGKEKITIRLDADVIAWLRERTEGGGDYQAIINDALRMHAQEDESVLAKTLRRVFREELGELGALKRNDD